MAAGDIYTVDFHLQLPELYPSSFSFSPAIADGTLRAYTTCDWIDNAIVLQMSPADGEIYGHLHLPCRVELNRCLAKSSQSLPSATRSRTLVEFTGERVIPGQVNDDLWSEHVARYAFASGFAEGKRVLDAGCGAGYGSAELAQTALQVTGFDIAPDAVEYARSTYPLPNLLFAAASCTATPFPPNSFELVVAFEVIEHLRLSRFLERMRASCHAAGPLHRFVAQQKLLRGVSRQNRPQPVSRT